jgi:holo-[acyl-carrier protein] synthase
VIVGSGIDIVEVERVEGVLRRRGKRFRERVFTERERVDCDRRQNPAPHFALRFAAKEAGMKAVGTGWRRGVGWRDFEVIEGPHGLEIELSGRALHFARERGGDRVWIAASTQRTHAVAEVVLERTSAA